MSGGRLAGAVIVACVLSAPRPATAAGAATGGGAGAKPAAAGSPLERLETRYARLLAQHRPDLAERYGATPVDVKFAALDEATVAGHVRELQQLADDAAGLPAGSGADSLRARLAREIAETSPGGALRRDPLLWLDVLDAAVRAPFALGRATGCDRTRRVTLQLRALPEAVRSATVLMRGAPPPDPVGLEARLTRLEHVLRQDLPGRTEPCKESRRRAEFVEADTLAAASLVEFRRWLSAGE